MLKIISTFLTSSKMKYVAQSRIKWFQKMRNKIRIFKILNQAFQLAFNKVIGNSSQPLERNTCKNSN
jgi:hypothetical protein